MDRFPLDLRLEKNGFSYNSGNSKIEASFESGSTMRKKTYRKVPDRFAGQIICTQAELEVLLNFYFKTLDEGIKAFIWSHPVSDAQISVLFVGEAPRYTSLEGDYFSFQAGYEIVDYL